MDKRKSTTSFGKVVIRTLYFNGERVGVVYFDEVIKYHDLDRMVFMQKDIPILTTVLSKTTLKEVE